MDTQTFVSQNTESIRADAFLSQALTVSRSSVEKLFEKQLVQINGKIANKKDKVSYYDVIVVALPPAEPLEAIAEDIPLCIVYEDDDLLVVNKPKGMVVHPAPGNPNGTLVNALLAHCGSSLSGINGVMRPGILHRIDKDTSGLLLVAKNDAAHTFLSQQIAEHSLTREYEAVVYGNFADDEGSVHAPIGRHPVKRKQMAVTYKNSKPAVTHYCVLERFGKFTHLRLRLETGRTHQIRVHMAHLGHPVAGDPVYGPKKDSTGLFGQCLHARRIGFIHPRTKEYMEFNSDLPAYFSSFLERIAKGATNGNF